MQASIAEAGSFAIGLKLHERRQEAPAKFHFKKGPRQP